MEISKKQFNKIIGYLEKYHRYEIADIIKEQDRKHKVAKYFVYFLLLIIVLLVLVLLYGG
jgi:hypothetical protein